MNKTLFIRFIDLTWVFRLSILMFMAVGTASSVSAEEFTTCAKNSNEHPVAYAGREECRASFAIYVDTAGKFLYMENIMQDPHRLVRVSPVRDSSGKYYFNFGTNQTDVSCAGGSKCLVCPMPNRCGCAC
jgi:hypothetical protein